VRLTLEDPELNTHNIEIYMPPATKNSNTVIYHRIKLCEKSIKAITPPITLKRLLKKSLGCGGGNIATNQTGVEILFHESFS
jgi:hypothetical protein